MKRKNKGERPENTPHYIYEKSWETYEGEQSSGQRKALIIVFAVTFVVLLILATLWAVFYNALSIRNTRDDLRKTIKIEKYEDLKALEGNLVLNNRYELETDILVKKGDSITIGSEAYPFTGIFDGKNFTIRYEMSEGEDLSALFRYVDEKAEIINLRVSGNAKLNEGGVGAAIAAYNRGTIRGCKVDSFRMEVDKYATAGGIAAYNYGNIEGCAARMSVERKGNGGVMQTFFGGMCTKNLDGRVKNAVTYITFTAFKETEIFDNYDEYEGGNYSIGAAVGLNQGETEGLVSAYGDAYLSDRFILEFKSAEELNDSFKFPNKMREAKEL